MPTKEEKKHPDPTEKKVSPAILAARAFNRIEALIDARNDELARAPESIAERYAEKIHKARLGLNVETQVLLDGLLEKAGHAEAKGGE